MSKFSQLPEEKQKIADRITKILVKGVEKHELTPPKPPQNPYDLSTVDRIYQLNFKRLKVTKKYIFNKKKI